MTSVAVTTQQATVTVTTAAGVTVVPTTQTAAVVVQAGVVAPGGVARDLLEKVSGADNHTRWTSTPEVDALGFDLTAGVTASIGQLAWNPDEQTLDLGKGGGVTLQLGSEQLSLCRNSTATEIPNGTAVRFAGTLGNSGRLLVAPMIADGTYPGYVFFGVATQAIASGADGFVCTFGKVRQVDTRAFEEGDVLWCDPATPGGFTRTEPLAPNLKLPVAAVISKATNGIIFVRTDTGRRLQDLHDVEANGGKNDLDVLTYIAATNRWEARPVGASVNGLPTGGDPGNILIKQTNANYDADWAPTLDGGTFN